MKHNWFDKCSQSFVYPQDVGYDIVTSGYLHGKMHIIINCVYAHAVWHILSYTEQMWKQDG